MENATIPLEELALTGFIYVAVNVPIFLLAANIGAHFSIKKLTKSAPVHFQMVPNIDAGTTKIDKRGISKEASLCINEFVYVLNKYDHIDLKFFYKNMRPFSIIKARKRWPWDKILGYYDLEEHIISYVGVMRDSLFHELLHLSSTYIFENHFFCGFSQEKIDEHGYTIYRIGQGLNEGYTQLLAERYFKEYGDRKGAYPLFVRIASYLEIIIGREKMESLYFDVNLEGLIQELEKVAPRDEIRALIKDLDYLYASLYGCIHLLPKVWSKSVYQRVLMRLSAMMKKKIDVENMEGKTDLREEKAVLYSMREYVSKKNHLVYKANAKTNRKLRQNEKVLFYQSRVSKGVKA